MKNIKKPPLFKKIFDDARCRMSEKKTFVSTLFWIQPYRCVDLAPGFASYHENHYKITLNVFNPTHMNAKSMTMHTYAQN